jgi:cyclopropane-fatty-acyl-phospholipid synthase
MVDLHTKAKELMGYADIEINGKKPGDVQILDERTYKEAFSKGSLGLGEAYMNGWWESDDLYTLFSKILSSDIDKKVNPLSLVPFYFRAKFLNMQTKEGSKKVIHEHYDLGNDLYEAMLDATMTYSCAYWKDAKDLNEAQRAKLDLICRKLGLEKGMKVLDIGCGWGGFAKFAAENYGVSVVGLTISKEQASLAKQRVKGLPVEIRIEDYRDAQGEFDRVLSIGMFEHVGRKNHRVYMKTVDRVLKPGGLQLLHTIGSYASDLPNDPWIEKYIFPNSQIPSLKEIAGAAEGLFIIEDVHNIRRDYIKTLFAWFDNFERNWPKLEAKYGDRFYRMWKYYLRFSASCFDSGRLQLFQVVLAKGNRKDGYVSVR